MEDKLIQSLIIEKYKKANIPRAYWNIELDNFKGDKESVVKVRKYISKFDRAYENGIGLYIYGAHGTGKTTLCNCILKEAIKTGKYSSWFTTLSSMILSCEERFTEESKDIIKIIKNVHFLGLDDIGKEYRTDSGFVEAKFNDIIRSRNMANYPIIFTSNKKPEELKEYGQSIYSVIKGHNIIIYVKGTDYRLEYISKEIDDIINGE